MEKLFRINAWILLFLLFPQFARAADLAVSVEPILNVDRVSPGQKFLLGYMFQLKAPWHIYWSNPGASGLPTRFKLSAPSGVQVGEVQWPTPSTFLQPGNIIGYGYQNAVLFYQEITVPSDHKLGDPLKLLSEVKWLGCSDLCVPGKKDFKLEVPVDNKTVPANEEIFKFWTSQLPEPSDHNILSIQKLKGELNTSHKTSDFEFSVEWETSQDLPEFFPYSVPGLVLENPTLQPQGTVSKITFKASAVGELHFPLKLPIVLKFRDKSGKEKGMRQVLTLSEP